MESLLYSSIMLRNTNSSQQARVRLVRSTPKKSISVKTFAKLFECSLENKQLVCRCDEIEVKSLAFLPGAPNCKIPMLSLSKKDTVQGMST